MLVKLFLLQGTFLALLPLLLGVAKRGSFSRLLSPRTEPGVLAHLPNLFTVTPVSE